MKFTRLNIPDVILIEPAVFEDPRGVFFESYHEEKFKAQGISARFVQDNQSASVKGVLRGLHYQIGPKVQGKLVRVVKGAAFDVVVDIRKNSKTFGQFVATSLTEKNRKMLYIPPGFAHGFCALEKECIFLYSVTDFYSPAHERGIKWDDPAIAIPWPKLDVPYLLSEKDETYPSLKDSKDLF
jgi:dTDP-4-dehydrorhamnose 3,5-epimerase